MEKTTQQQEIIKAVQDSMDNLIIEAKAGAGKTSTLLMIYEECELGNSKFLAFNKAIADELQAKGVNASTMHSEGGKICRDHIPFFKINGNKLKNIIKYKLPGNCILSGTGKDLDYRKFNSLKNIISYMKRELLWIMPQTAKQYYELLDRAGEDAIIPDYEAIPLLNQLVPLLYDIDAYKVLDFDDLITRPLKENYLFPIYDTILVDEAQDLNYAQHMFIEKLVERGARLIAVGDSKQAIYGFRGAKSNSLGLLANMFNCTTLKLSKSFRCREGICERVRHIEPDIQSFFNDQYGACYAATELKPDGDCMVLCRTNKPLVEYAIQLQKQGIPCYIKGTDLGQELISHLKEDLYETKKHLGVRLQEANSCNWVHQMDKYTQLLEIVDIIEERTPAYNKPEVTQVIKDLFSVKGGVPLMTIHKSKGLEADTVYLVRPDLLPFPNGDPEQEENLEYVAVTRARYNFVTVEP